MTTEKQTPQDHVEGIRLDCDLVEQAAKSLTGAEYSSREAAVAAVKVRDKLRASLAAEGKAE
jgi:hypothetical protein